MGREGRPVPPPSAGRGAARRQGGPDPSHSPAPSRRRATGAHSQPLLQLPQALRPHGARVDPAPRPHGPPRSRSARLGPAPPPRPGDVNGPAAPPPPGRRPRARPRVAGTPTNPLAVRGEWGGATARARPQGVLPLSPHGAGDGAVNGRAINRGWRAAAVSLRPQRRLA